jgi:predicted DNA-binding transcriptional regulator AlpA
MKAKTQSPEPLKIEPAILNITGLARYLGVGRTTVYEWLYSEQLPPAAKIINRRRYWTKKQIEQFLEKETL